MTTTLAVVGGGWAGLAAAVRATDAGATVTLFEMASQLGGRARRMDVDGLALDNGQHILIGAYTHCLALLRRIGIDPEAVLLRCPLALRYADGRGLQLPGGPPALAFCRAVMAARGFGLADKAALLTAASGWLLRGFRCSERSSVEQLCAGLPGNVRRLLIDPLCVAALNTPARQASATVFLRVLRDALFGGRGAADLLLPRCSLGQVLPEPAQRWLLQSGAEVRTGQRVQALRADGPRWLVDGVPFDAVVLACSAGESARLTAAIEPAWSDAAAAVRHEPIVTVYLRGGDGASRLPAPMTALLDGPAQFAFDHGAIGGAAGVFAFVISGAADAVSAGSAATASAVLAQARALGCGGTLSVLRVVAEKRATFACVPAMARPPAAIAPRLAAAGDYIAGPYPATLEGAVRAGEAAVRCTMRK